MLAVARPFGAQRNGVVGEDSQEKDVHQKEATSPVTPPSTRPAALRAATVSKQVAPVTTTAKKTKVNSKRPSTNWACSEDSGRFCPQPAKRCKLLDAGGKEPTEEMRGLEAVVVNLDRRPDRMEGCSERLRLHCPWLKHTRLDASDGRRDVISRDDVGTSWNTAANVVYQKKRAIRKGWDDLDSYQVRDLELSPGERGCSMSHIRAWQLCVEQAGETNKPLLVLEDDADPTVEFTSVLRRALASLPSDADVLYLGYSQAAEWRREVSENLVESEYVWTTVGYIVWPAGARKMLTQRPVEGPVDNWMAGLAATGELKSYAVRPKVVLQADAWNVNSDVGHSDEQYWGPSADSNILHSDAFYWGNPNTTTAQPQSSIFAGIDDASEEESEDSANEDL